VNVINIFFYTAFFFSYANVYAATNLVAQKIEMTISNASNDERSSKEVAVRMFLKNPDLYLGGDGNSEYKKCKVLKQSASVYMQGSLSTDIINDRWNVTLQVTCVRIKKNADSIIGDVKSNSLKRDTPKDQDETGKIVPSGPNVIGK
jgi:hypothetical protein